MKSEQRPGFWLGWFVPTFFVAIPYSIFLVTRDALISDTDALYHIGHALAYRENGIGNASLPWASASMIGAIGGDLWYGFHVLLLPIIAFITDPAQAMPLAQAWVLGLGFFALSFAFREANVPGAWFWPLLVYSGTEYGPWRAMMLRPGVISLGLLLLVIVALAKGRPWMAAVAAFLFAFIHLTVAWLVPVAVGLVVLFQWIAKEPRSLSTVMATMCGVLVGSIARPNPIGTFELLRIQLVDVAQLLRHDPPLRFGVEVTEPLAGLTWANIAWPFALVWLAALVWGGLQLRRSEKSISVPIWGTCAALSIGFLAITLIQSSRTIELWTATSVAVVALLWEPAIGVLERQRWAVALLLVPLGIVGWNTHQGVNIIHKFGRSPVALRPVAEWLRDNAESDSVVFHPLWEDFPGLFAYNRGNRYIGGMDPVFQFRYDEEKYWIAHWMSEDRATHLVATTEKGFDGPTEPMSSALRERFDAQYLVIPVPRLGSLSQHLNGQPEFRLEGIFGNSAVYRILPLPTQK